MPKVTSLFFHLMYVHKFSAFTITETEFAKPVFKLAPPGHDQLFDITAPDLCEPSISDVVLPQMRSQESTPAQNCTADV